MSAARRFALVVSVALVTAAFGAASAHAQACPGNPSGGTSLRPALEEGTGSVGLKDFSFRGLSIDAALRSWVSAFAASRSFVTVAPRPVAGHTLSAIAPRKIRGR